MIISDLNHLETVSQENMEIAGGSLTIAAISPNLGVILDNPINTAVSINNATALGNGKTTALVFSETNTVSGLGSSATGISISKSETAKLVGFVGLK